MLPNLNVVICGIVLSVIAFGATGNGIIMPQTYTRIGKPPAVSRPIRPTMESIVADEPARAPNAMTEEHRDQEPARLLPQAAVPVAEPVAASRDGGQPSGEPVMPAEAAAVTAAGVASVAAAPPVPDLASELRMGTIAGHAAPVADVADAPAPAPEAAIAPAPADAAATDAIESAPAAPHVASPETGAAAAVASMSVAPTGEPPGGKTQDTTVADHDATDAIPASPPPPAVHAPVRLRRARPVAAAAAAAHPAAVAAHKPVVRHARPHVPQPAASPAAAPNPATPVTGLFGQTNFNPAPPHQ